MLNPRTPVLVGVGQVVSHWDGSGDAPDPVSLGAAAARAALADAGPAEALAAALDVVAVVRTNVDSVPGMAAPFGRCANPPGTLALAIGAAPRRAIHSQVGGDQPQALVSEFAEAIHAGEAEAVLLAGGEAIAAMKRALRAGLALDWSRSVGDDFEDRGTGGRLLSGYEIANGLGFPTRTYPAFEHALRARMGLGRDAYRGVMSELWAGFSRVAAAHPTAQFPVERSADFLATRSAENYDVADPYLKWHVAQDAVNQGAAVVMTSVAKARALGIDPAKWIYLHGYAQAADRFVTERADLSRSRAFELVLARTLQAAGREAQDIAHLDLYSCFPCAVLIAAEALGVDWRAVPLTVTGGLPFFGGAGNNYAMHAIVTMAERLRADRGAFGLVLANGGFLSKAAAGIYSAMPVEDWRPVASDDLQAEIDAAPRPRLLNESTDATVETYTMTYAKGVPDDGYVIARDGDARILAWVRPGDGAILAALSGEDPVGLTVGIEHTDGINWLAVPPVLRR